MSFWSKLIKIAPYAAAPFTGGASLAFAPAASSVGSMLEKGGAAAGAASQSMAGNRGTKAELLLDVQSELEKQLLAREREKREAQSDAYQKAMYGANAMQWKPTARPAGVPSISFTRGPGKLGMPAAKSLYEQAMQRMGASDLASQVGMPKYEPIMQNKEFLKTLKPGVWERLMGIMSVAGPMLGPLYSGVSGTINSSVPSGLPAGTRLPGVTLPGGPR